MTGTEPETMEVKRHMVPVNLRHEPGPDGHCRKCRGKVEAQPGQETCPDTMSDN